ncbi:MAG: cytochrome c peroxidase [Chitinophagaceae bacterium]
MRKWLIIALLITATFVFVSFTQQEEKMNADKLRKLYSQSPDKWPAPFIDPGVQWTELGILPESPIQKHKDSLKNMIELGKMLFFDTRLSGSGKISCATCHQPELNWTDGKERSIGHEGAMTKRNSPTIQNSWFYHRLFWDGRAKDLQDQAFGPINSETEMNSEMPEVMGKLRGNKQYRVLFKQAFGYDDIGPDELAKAIATFEKTIVSRKSRFDEFLAGKKKALSNSELRGLHLFRTKARCINCHNGPLFSDNQFHNNGFHLYENGFIDSAKFDKGLYNVTHKDSDFGKFKTPSVRDVMRTGPWMHNGMMAMMDEIISHYSKGADGNGSSDKLIKMLYLRKSEKEDLLAFLHAISAPPVVFKKPVLPE